MLKTIAAVSENWGIGKNGDLLFSLPTDMKFFRQTTAGGVVIMGRKTLESWANDNGMKLKPSGMVVTPDVGYLHELDVQGNEALKIAMAQPGGAPWFMNGYRKIGTAVSHKALTEQMRTTCYVITPMIGDR